MKKCGDNKMGKKSLVVVSGIIAGAAFAVSAPVHAVHADSTKSVTIGSVTSDAVIWKHIAQSPQAKADHLKIHVKVFTDGPTLNKSTANGDVDVNAFQSYSYFAAFNKEAGSHKLANLGTTYIEPMGLFSDKYKSVKDIPDGSTFALASDNANEARGLKLLAKEGFITLKSNFGALSSTKDIASNPHHFKFEQIDDTTGVTVLKNDKNVAGVMISNSTALAGHLNVLKDSIAHETVNAGTRANINILATRASEKDNPTYKKLVKLYHNKDIQAWISKKYQGTKVEVQKPTSYLK